jgi:hypothetical protein
MAPRKKASTLRESGSKATPSRRSLDDMLQEAVRKLEGSRMRRTGSILFRFVGEGGGDFHVHSYATGCSLSREAGQAPPLIEIIGDPEQIRAVLEGGREGLAQFYRGGIRVRGDLQYLSELAHELGFIREPFFVGR